MFKAATIGSVVTIACVLVPLVHFITAIPGAFIGGYIAGLRIVCPANKSFFLGSLMALQLVVPIFICTLIVAMLFEYSLTFAVYTSLVFVVWFGLSGTLGVYLGGATARKKNQLK